jgi:peptidoglycan/LPS O-acetylase OafA/YrhL
MMRSVASILVLLTHCVVFSALFPSNNFPEIISGKSAHMFLLLVGIINVFFIMSGFLAMTSIKYMIEKYKGIKSAVELD